MPMKDVFQQALSQLLTCFEKLEERAEGRIEMKKLIFTCKIKKKKKGIGNIEYKGFFCKCMPLTNSEHLGHGEFWSSGTTEVRVAMVQMVCTLELRALWLEALHTD